MSNAPLDTPLHTLAEIASSRWRIELMLKEAKKEAGLDDYEVRYWHSWYRHITLSMLAHTWLTLLRQEERKKSRLPAWLTYSLAELRRLLNSVWPSPALSADFRLKWFVWRRHKRLQEILSRYRVVFQRGTRSFFNLPMRL